MSSGRTRTFHELFFIIYQLLSKYCEYVCGHVINETFYYEFVIDSHCRV